MYSKHYHQYEPSVKTNIVARFRSVGWTPPSEREDYKARFQWFQTLGWKSEIPEPRVTQ